MNARHLAGLAAACFMLGGTAAVLSADAPPARDQAPSSGAPPAPRAHEFWPAPRPPGVPAARWIPINAEFGVVVVEEAPPPLTGPREPIPRTLSGYFAVHHDGRWWRLATSAGGSLVPLAAASRDPAQD